MMNDFLSAIRFLTLLPAGKGDRRFDAVSMLAWFPVAGLVVGAILAVFDWAALHLWPPYVAAVLDVLLLAVVTGALHLDGIGDTADGLFAHHSPARALEIMKDSRVGAMGLIAVVLCLAVKWAGISALADGHRFLSLLVVPAFARGALIFAVTVLPYGRDAGTGQSFFERSIPLHTFLPLAAPIVLALFLGPRFLLLIAGFAAVTAAAIFFYKKRIGGITGDMLGALCETEEALLFLLLAAGGAS
ncbi:MAG: adenosylcobinamide-GDP ribazoletransferase [Thermodesulfobacteriota bacterium]